MSGSDRVSAPDEKKKDDENRVNMLQVTAATGASTTAAIVATLLGVYGTVIGVAVISLVSSITTVLYVRSINSTKDKIRKVNPRVGRLKRESSKNLGTDATMATYSSADPDSTTAYPSVDADTTTARLGQVPEPNEDSTEAAPVASSAANTTARGRVSVAGAMANAEPDDIADNNDGAWWRDLTNRVSHNWRPILITTCIVFALSIVTLTSIALLSGQDANTFYRSKAPVSDTSQTPTDENTDGNYQEEPSTVEPSDSESESSVPTPDENSPSPEPTEPTEPQQSEEPTEEEPTAPNEPAPQDPGDNTQQ